MSSETTSAGDEGLVPMTPRIMPGAGDQSPLMTWGAVGTPRILESDDRRQELGRALDARAKRRRDGAARALAPCGRRWTRAGVAAAAVVVVAAGARVGADAGRVRAAPSALMTDVRQAIG